MNQTTRKTGQSHAPPPAAVFTPAPTTSRTKIVTNCGNSD